MIKSIKKSQLLEATKISNSIADGFKETLKISSICPDALVGNEACSSLLIFKILKQVTYVYDDFQIKPQKKISGNLGNGRVDYAVEHKEVSIMITEAKREDFDQGVS